ncbi:hypothetical protein BFF78_38185 [Streptomyces fodineus]|uniref:Uncharacterized protein n=1 Tax=Streptomyces fodineus TaxID=1904616 RepID=A0A1D7YKP8_9ACTN|nr:hypothetical protein [Streptomyces fodineus]AOR36110.1 hypothetical protein BFF78_38185 [Streptomyces fodineus]
MAESAKDFCSDLLDLSGISLAELYSSDDPALRRALSVVDGKAVAAFGTLAGDSDNSDEMRFVRGRRPDQCGL